MGNVVEFPGRQEVDEEKEKEKACDLLFQAVLEIAADLRIRTEGLSPAERKSIVQDARTMTQAAELLQRVSGEIMTHFRLGNLSPLQLLPPPDASRPE